MKLVAALSMIIAALPSFAGDAAPPAMHEHPRVVLVTNRGDITLELLDDEAPASVRNFLQYVESGFYDGTIFHRVVEGFVIQGGGFTRDMQRKATRPPVANEADNGLHNGRGTVAMARTRDPHSATSQFFVNLADNAFLDHRSKTGAGWGYTVFARVTDGMDVVDEIAAGATTTVAGMQNVPVDPVVIESARVLSPPR